MAQNFFDYIVAKDLVSGPPNDGSARAQQASEGRMHP